MVFYCRVQSSEIGQQPPFDCTVEAEQIGLFVNRVQVAEDALPGKPAHFHLECVVDRLLALGNSLAYPYRWGSNREGYFCHLKNPIDFDLLGADFTFPKSIHLARHRGLIYCERTGCVIKHAIA